MDSNASPNKQRMRQQVNTTGINVQQHVVKEAPRRGNANDKQQQQMAPQFYDQYLNVNNINMTNQPRFVAATNLSQPQMSLPLQQKEAPKQRSSLFDQKNSFSLFQEEDDEDEDDDEEEDDEECEDDLEEDANQNQSNNGAATSSTKKVASSKSKKTKGRVKIDMEYIENKIRRYTTFSKRKTGIMKKAYELSTLTGTQVMLLVASETGHVYTFATEKLQPMITSETGKHLIQSCLSYNQPEENTDNVVNNPPHSQSSASTSSIRLIDSNNNNARNNGKGFEASSDFAAAELQMLNGESCENNANDKKNEKRKASNKRATSEVVESMAHRGKTSRTGS